MRFHVPRAAWLSRWATDSAVQAGIAGASWSIAGSYARGLLPRSPLQQAIATGVVAATHFQLSATAWATLQAIGSRPGTRPGPRANLALATAGVVGGLSMSALGQRDAERSLVAAGVGTAGRIISFASLAGGASALWDAYLQKRLRMGPGLDTTLVPAIATASGVVAVSMLQKHRRAAEYGMVAPERHAVSGHAREGQALAVGAAAGIALLVATAGEQAAARLIERGLGRLVGGDPGALGGLLAHGVVLGAVTAGGITALNVMTARVQKKDDIIEPAYPDPPTSPHVSAGPASSMPFDSLGKEGRRFVLMALSAEDITAVMGEPAVDPVRVVGGYESASDIEERARLTVEDMTACGAFDRALICVGSPTGVGYFNYSIAEALEYLTRGDCAIVVPQYALVPSALALPRTRQAEDLTRRVLELIRDHLATMPEEKRPAVVLIGESLGANVALDLCSDADGADLTRLDSLGVHGGLYLGVPFRTRTWIAWREDAEAVDGTGRLVLVSQPDEIDPPDSGMRHLMVVHHDDPVNKYGYRMLVQPPWWMGAPATRPPLVPRETKFRPITTFVLATIDLLNGMQSKPGTFVRRGHDYRIDIRTGLQAALGMACTSEQAAAIETALRTREQDWATRRMVARKLDKARRAIEKQLAEWGTPNLELADLDPTLASLEGGRTRIGMISGPPGM
ncbi:MAG: hypothetical protein GC156_02490 [Actinomycetales bacterium]|nr:hypothetical protein [Actinomycetales bacterium]